MGEEFNKWVEKAKNMESYPVYSRVLQVAEEVEKANEQLSRVLIKKILQFSDWMGIPIKPYRITLVRLRRLLLDQIKPEEEQVLGNGYYC